MSFSNTVAFAIAIDKINQVGMSRLIIQMGGVHLFLCGWWWRCRPALGRNCDNAVIKNLMLVMSLCEQYFTLHHSRGSLSIAVARSMFHSSLPAPAWREHSSNSTHGRVVLTSL